MLTQVGLYVKRLALYGTRARTVQEAGWTVWNAFRSVCKADWTVHKVRRPVGEADCTSGLFYKLCPEVIWFLRGAHFSISRCELDPGRNKFGYSEK